MSTLNIQIGDDLIKGKMVKPNKWEFWLDSKKFILNTPEGRQDAVEVTLHGSSTLQAKQLQPNIWTAEDSFYGSSAWGSVFIQYTFEFNTESMTAFIDIKSDTSA